MLVSREKLPHSKLSLGMRIKALRERQEIGDRADLAEEMTARKRAVTGNPDERVTYETCRNWENGKSYPDALEMLILLDMCQERQSFEAFGLDLSRFCDKSEVEKEQKEKGVGSGKLKHKYYKPG